MAEIKNVAGNSGFGRVTVVHSALTLREAAQGGKVRLNGHCVVYAAASAHGQSCR